ncbi:hypothetical protein MKX03_029605 [Papaver bracteatum]|nr:hypothetical protein MKX03_029605 [Papaver bracteatum]
MVLMIIKGLFRRYEKWNPVHPTTGAFWGMGLGVGCGVGWGPGFGHEVICYVVNTLPAMRNMTVDGWNHIQPQISGFQRDISRTLYGFNHQDSASPDFGLIEMRRKLTCQARSVLECLGAFRKRCLPPVHKGT